MSIKAARIETKQTLMTLTWSQQKTPLIFKMTRFVLCISFGEIIPNLTIEWYAQPATRSFEISGPICPSDQDLASTKIVCFQNMGDYTHQAAKMVEQKKNPSQKTGVNSGSGGQKCLTQVVGIYKDEGFTKVYECDPHKIFEWSCCCCLVCSFGGGWGEGRLEWSLLEVEVPPSKDESLVKDMAIIEELSQQICWSSIFFSLKSFGHHISTDMEKSHPNRNQTIPNWIEINPPKSTHKKATNHTPKLKPHFNSIHFQPPYFLSGRLGGPHGWTTLQGDALGDSLCELCLSGGMSAQPLREGVFWLGRWLSSWLIGWLICWCWFVWFCWSNQVFLFVW